MRIKYAASLLFGAAAAGVVAYVLSGNEVEPARAVSPVKSAPDRVVVLPSPTAATPATGGERQDRLVQGEIASLKSQLERLRRDVYAEMRAMSERSADSGAVGNVGTETAFDPSIDTPEAAKEREERAIDTFADHFDSVLSREAADVRGRNSQQDEVASYFASHGVTSSRIDAFDCSQSLCRMIVRHDESGDLDSFLDLVGDGPLSAGSFYYQTDDGRETVVYVARPGHEERFHQIMQGASQTLGQ